MSWVEREEIDYTHALDVCSSFARYVMIVEDDTLTVEGLLPKVQSLLADADRAGRDVLIKLFFPDTWSGYTLPFFLKFTAVALLASAVLGAGLTTVTVGTRRKTKAKKEEGKFTCCHCCRWFAVAVSIAFPLIFFSYLAGRQQVFGPFTDGARGYHPFPSASTIRLLYSTQQAQRVARWVRANEHRTPIDLAIGKYVAQHTGSVHAVLWKPGLVQHVGMSSSSPQKSAAKDRSIHNKYFWINEDSRFVYDDSEAECAAIAAKLKLRLDTNFNLQL